MSASTPGPSVTTSRKPGEPPETQATAPAAPPRGSAPYPTGGSAAGQPTSAGARSAPPAGWAPGQPLPPTSSPYQQPQPAQPAAAATTTAPARSTAAPTGRKVRLTVSRVDPWSVMKLSFLISVAIGIALVVMVAVLWLILDGMNVFNSINGTIQDVAGANSTFNLMDYIALGRVLSLTIVIAVVDVVLLTALSTLSAFLYNLCSSLVGGVQLTLSDD